jgi:hypothetical protein
MMGALRHRPSRNPGRSVSIPRRMVKLQPTMVSDVDGRVAPLVTELIPGGFRLFFEVTAVEFWQFPPAPQFKLRGW